jgi:hypothetical protein
MTTGILQLLQLDLPLPLLVFSLLEAQIRERFSDDGFEHDEDNVS